MSRAYRPMLLALVAVLAFFVINVSAQAGSNAVYCSNQNTATNEIYSWDYQSNGNCTNHCNEEGRFAFAVIKWKDCYCSNYAPAERKSMNECQEDCPGFPAEKCGSLTNDRYIYLRLGGSPSGTAGADGKPVGATSSAIVSSSPPPPPPSPSVRVSTPPPVIVTVQPSNTPQPSQAPQEASTSFQVITESGVTIIRTIIQTPTPTPNPTSSTAPVRTGNGGGSNVGAIAGGVAGGIVGLLAIIGIAVFILWRRRKQQRAAREGGPDGGSAGITRNTSTMSKAGLLGGATEVGLQHPGVANQYGSQYSRYAADNQSTSSPTSNRRNSQPLIVDSRMNPEVYIQHANANNSSESIGTIDDSRDYARKLGVRNPDP